MEYKDKLDSDIGIFLGLAIGDAMGAPIEFKPSREPDDYITKYMSGGVHDERQQGQLALRGRALRHPCHARNCPSYVQGRHWRNSHLFHNIE